MPKSTSLKKPIRLPPLKVLRLRNPNLQEEHPCVLVLSSVLACWASAGFNTGGCVTIEQKLRECMDTPRPPTTSRNNTNYQLMRWQKQLAGKIYRK